MSRSTTHITTSGGLISAAFIENIREPGSRQRGVAPASFALPWSPAPKRPAALEETVATAWELLLERWDAVRADLPTMDVSQVRSRWLLPLFQLLDFEPIYLRGDTVLDEAGRLRFSLSHRGWEGEDAPIIHTVIPSQNLDARMAAGRRVKAKSPHDVLQAFLNASPADLWAVLTNGVLLRLLRDYHHTFTKGYIQFDLESIFETRNYGDFRALYRLCHASRFIPFSLRARGSEGGLLPLERFYKDSLATGIRVGEDLRGQVRQAIETLGNGFLDGELIRRLQADSSPLPAGGTEGGQALCRCYYGEILHIIYRVLFLLFAEQRGMLPRVGAPLEDLYRSEYSIAALRTRAEGDTVLYRPLPLAQRNKGTVQRIPREDGFTDLWEGLKVTFRTVREGVPDLGVFGYDGMLFAEDQTPLLNGRAVRNSDLLRAIRALTLIEREGVLQRISYADLGVEELGAIYESLLDFTPHVTTGPDAVNGREIPANTFFLDPRGSERKTTGSYYTHPSLVNELCKSALLPVARDRLAAAGLPVIEEETIGEATAGLLIDYADLSDTQRAAGEAAILSLKVCDPAAGSGHFLVKANNALGAELARVRTGDEYPAEAVVQAARRDVLTHCLYAVDLNPMAVELCKVSLWINASVGDRPLSFLDHHIKCGNSLIGATPELMAEGIPYQAFDQKIAGNDRDTANAIRARNRQEQAGQIPLAWQVTVIETPEDLERWRQLSQLAEEQPKVAREQYAAYLAADEYRRKKLEADSWTAAFFWPLPRGTEWAPTHGEFVRLCAKGPEALPPEALVQVEALAERYRFFHWHLEFPGVFGDEGPGTKDGSGSPASSSVSRPSSADGFDVVLGNPPWERIKLQEKEFFADKDPAIANARTAAQRRKLIRKLPQTNPALHAAYTAALRDSEASGHFLRESGRYPLTGVGDVNTYAVFAGLARQILTPTGRAGIIIPLGIATDYTYRDFFADVVDSGQLVSFYDFENREGIFPGVHRNYNFALTTLVGTKLPRSRAEFAFFMTHFDHLQDEDRCFTLSSKDLALINPNTRTCPIFNTRHDAELTRKLYRACPVLHNEEAAKNPWNVSFFTIFHMANDSNLFRTCEELEAKGYALKGNHFVHDDELYLPLYEAKMIQQFDHRFGSVRVNPENPMRQGITVLTSLTEHQDALFVPTSRYWVFESNVTERINERQWLIGFRDVTDTRTNARTGMFALMPRAAVGHTISLIFLNKTSDTNYGCAFMANANSLPTDYVIRQKLGGLHLSYFIVRQLPIFPPDRYTPDLLDFVVPRVVELTYTAWDLQPFAQDVLAEAGPERWARWFKDAPVHTSAPPAGQSATPAPFVWDEARRARLRAELDGLYAHLYGLTRDELAYILDTFPIVRRRDEEKYGEYRTKRMVLEAYEGLESLMH